MSTEEPDFEGHADRECGEHRTTGGRAWCHSCSQWCYPSMPCAGCELPQLRATVQRLQSRITAAMTLLDPAEIHHIAGPLADRIREALADKQGDRE